MTDDRSSLRSERIAAIRARLEQARREVIALANGSKKWRMSIPAEPDDTDLVLFGAIDDALAELDRLARDRALVREAIKDEQLSDLACRAAIAMVVDPEPVTEADIEWARKELARLAASSGAQETPENG